METSCSSSPNHVKNSRILRALCSSFASAANATKRVAKDDPRRVIHAIKVAVAVSLVSLFYYLHPLYGSLGESAMWAVLTVVVIFEFSVGATLGKGVNRMIATCVAGGLAVGAHRLADLCGEAGEPIVLFVSGFIVAAIFTFMRFFPELKARYDYGLMIFILTFSMVAASGYRDDEVFPVAWRRLVTIIIGCVIAIIVCIFICPVWSGQELHTLSASNLDKLGSFLEGFGGEYFKGGDKEKADDDKSLLVKYVSVLATKVNEETMANFARWEPRHGHFRARHPWKQYLKIGALARQCAYKIDALNSVLSSDNSQVKTEIRDQFRKTCVKLSFESGKALKELSNGMKKMKRVSLQVKDHAKESKSASNELKSLLESKGLEGFSLLDLLPMATITSMLIEIAACTEEIVEAVHELDTSFVHMKAAVESAVVPTEEPSVKEGIGEGSGFVRLETGNKEVADGHVVVVINEIQDDGSVKKKMTKT